MKYLVLISALLCVSFSAYSDDIEAIKDRAERIVKANMAGEDQLGGNVARYSKGAISEDLAGGTQVAIIREETSSRCTHVVEFKSAGGIYINSAVCEGE